MVQGRPPGHDANRLASARVRDGGQEYELHGTGVGSRRKDDFLWDSLEPDLEAGVKCQRKGAHQRIVGGCHSKQVTRFTKDRQSFEDILVLRQCAKVKLLRTGRFPLIRHLTAKYSAIYPLR